MRTNYKNLAHRDMALAALVGAVGGDDFGVEFGDDLMGVDFGDDWGAESAMVQVAPPTKEAALSAYAKMAHQKAMGLRRSALLEPNKGSPVKIERYVFSLTEALVLGTASTIDTNNNPDTNFRPQRCVMNAPAPGFATISNIKAANVSAAIGGDADAYMFSAGAVGTSLDLPTLTPANRLSITGSYTGFVPPGYVNGAAYTFVASFTGPASVIA